ncbi:MAG TPA: hypothetical protein VLB27_00635, partial [candidate division Zixibacteria bacterium]|nr:hypothetical protein [candidate division Zixibacteria bacterium]
GGLMFKFKEMSMNLTYKQIADNIWFPERFYMWGKAKASIFFTVRFEVEELYSNPRLNTGLDTDLFTEPMSYATTDGATSQ